MSEKPKAKRKRKPAAPKPKPEIDEVEVVEDVTPITLDDIVDRVMGMVNTVRAKGVTTVTRRFFAGLEGFLGEAAGDKEKKPPRKG